MTPRSRSPCSADKDHKERLIMAERDNSGRYAKGHGGGRPKGSRNKFTDLKQPFLQVFSTMSSAKEGNRR